MAEKKQSFENHTKFVPLFHGIVLPALTVNVLWTVYRLYRYPAADTAMHFVLALTLLAFAFNARVTALRVQDRVIRLEMRLRLRELLSSDLRGRIEELTPRQLIAMRFASDAE